MPSYAVKFRLPLDESDATDGGYRIGSYFNHKYHALEDYACKTFTYYTATYAHAGTDIIMQALPGSNGWKDYLDGRDVVAAASGTVLYAVDGYFDQCSTGGCQYAGASAFGNYVRILHSDGTYSYYAHMKKGSITVKPGDKVNCGDVIGQVGSSGNSSGFHLHFEVRTAEDNGDPNVGRPKSIDPYAGPCSPTSESLWTAQGEYKGFPAPQCEGESDPTPIEPTVYSNKSLTVSKSILDYTSFTPNTPFTQTITFKNEGTLNWSKAKGFSFRFVRGENISSEQIDHVDLPDNLVVRPGETVTLSIPMRSPLEGGTYYSYWNWDYRGVTFGDIFWTMIYVRPPNNRADILSSEQDINNGVLPGAMVTKSWTFKNTGNTIWKSSDSYGFKRVMNKYFEADDRFSLESDEEIRQNETKTWTISFRVPQNLAPGYYTEYWQNTQYESTFGTRAAITIYVAPRRDEAVFVTETIEDYSIIPAGQKFLKTWTFKNTGNTTWNAGYSFAFKSGNDMGSETHSFSIVEPVAPNQEITFEVPMTAPDETGIYKGYWAMKNSNENWFGTTVWVIIQVK